MKVFAHSAKDMYLVILSVLQVMLLAYGALTFGHVSLGTTLALGAAMIFLHCTNYQCISHNFLHNAFFESKLLNRVFSIVNSLGIGYSQTRYRSGHLQHHKYNNDDKDPVTGTTQDYSSTYRYSRRPGKEENIFTYSLMGVVRSNKGFLRREVGKQSSMDVRVEFIAVLLFWTVLGLVSWKGLLFFVLPTWYLGHSASYWQNYLEHHGALPGNRMTDSVSCYNPIYNFIWFNNGYHQEHHYRPQVHWTRITALREVLPPPSARRVVRGAHWFNFNPPPRSHYQAVTRSSAAEPE
jgi:fatty acid desaturase